MKKIFKISSLIALCAAVVFNSCAQEEVDTEQFSNDEVVFGSFAPNPVIRGGVIRIVGSNLEQVKEVQIPGISPITSIEVVSSGKYSEIRVTVPVDGPEVGPIKIVTKDGKTLSSLADLTYTESIVLGSCTPTEAMPGDVITIKGDYLNLIKVITFGGNAAVKEFQSQSRYEIQVVVPAEAITGKALLSDVDEDNNPDGAVANLFYTEDDIVIGDPTIKSADRGTLKAGDVVTIEGSHLEMINKVTFNGVEAELNYADGKITVALPETAGDGEIVLTSYAGNEFSAGAYTTKTPSGIAVKASDRFKAGQTIVISGKDLDLVSGVQIGGVDCDYTVQDNGIKAVIPAASAEGVVTLILANGKTVDSEKFELVKPTITKMSPLELYAGDENITVTGKDLDLVTGATLGGKAAEFEITDEKTLVVKTDVTSVSGKVVLTLANGVEVKSDDEVTVKYHSLVIVTDRPDGQHIAEEVVLKGSNFDLVENIFIGNEKVTKYSLRTPEEVRFLVPSMKVGLYDMTFKLFNGDEEVQPAKFEVLLERVFNVLWEGSSDVTWSGGAVTALSWGGYAWDTVKKGATLMVEFVTAGGQIRLGNGSWAALPTTKTYSNADGDGNLSIGESDTYVSVVLSADDLNQLVTAGGLVVCGTGYTCKKITLITEISQEKTIWSGSQKVAWQDSAPYLDAPGNKALQALAWGGYDWSTVEAGTTISVYYNIIPDDGYSQIRMGNGNWSALPGTPDTTDITNGDGKHMLVLDDAMLAELRGTGLVICGNGYEITEVTLKD